ncbi:MAG: hypothetical protein EA416_12890 [Trueperaceae bacterium]|nr:MAG: hypothetical protein EA416_12890 [Trueperaceae bacterium]
MRSVVADSFVPSLLSRVDTAAEKANLWRGKASSGHSAPSPLFEEPERLRTILRDDVLVGANALADER